MISDEAAGIASQAYDREVAAGATHEQAWRAALADALEVVLGEPVEVAIAQYERMRDGVGGCTDGGCVIKRPIGLRTNGGCKCWNDKMKAQRMMRAGQELFNAINSAINNGEKRL